MKLRRIVALSAVLVLVGATAASAAGPPYTVLVGGNSTVGASFITATTTGTVQMSVRNNAGTIINYNCTAVDLSSTVTRGTQVNPLAAIDSTNWRGCRLPGERSRSRRAGLEHHRHMRQCDGGRYRLGGRIRRQRLHELGIDGQSCGV